MIEANQQLGIETREVPVPKSHYLSLDLGQIKVSGAAAAAAKSTDGDEGYQEVNLPNPEEIEEIKHSPGLLAQHHYLDMCQP